MTKHTPDQLDALSTPNPQTQQEQDQLDALDHKHKDELEEVHHHTQQERDHIANQKAYDVQETLERQEALELFGILKPQVTTEDSDNFDKLNIPRDDSPDGLHTRAEQILSIDPMRFLLNDLGHRIEGDKRNMKVVLLSFMSMHPKISTLIHQQIIGQSGGGKSYLVFECRKLLPETHKLPWTEISPKALNNYSKNNSEEENAETLANRLLFLDDAKEGDIPILKTLGNNDGEIPSGMVAQDGNAVEWRWDGYPLTIISTVSPLEDEGGQISSRYLTYNIEESAQHTANILEKQRTEEVSNVGKIEMDPVCERILFNCLTLTIDRIQLCQYEYPSNITSRNHKFYQSLIKCNALLNHKNRTITNHILHTSPDDVKEVSALWSHISIYNDEKLSKISIGILGILKPRNKVRGPECTITGLAKALNSTNPTITKYLNKMKASGMVGYSGTIPKSYFTL